MGQYRLEFYEDEDGDEPVRRWLRAELSRTQRLVIGTAMREVLEEEGINVCGTEFGRQLGGGLFEFRIGGQISEFVERAIPDPGEEKILVRVFCHAYGDKLILLLAGYDKLAHTSTDYQNEEIKVARQRLTAWKLSQAKAAKAAKKAKGKPKRAKSRRSR